MDSPNIETIELLKPAELFAAWRYFDRMEQQGELDPVTARRCKRAVFERMLDLGLKPDDIAPPSDF